MLWTQNGTYYRHYGTLHQLINQFNERPKLEWVTSHEDDDLMIDIATLPIEIQSKIEENVLVIRGLQQLHYKPRVPLGSSSKVMLHHNEPFITKHQTIITNYNTTSNSRKILHEKILLDPFCVPEGRLGHNHS